MSNSFYDDNVLPGDFMPLSKIPFRVAEFRHQSEIRRLYDWKPGVFAFVDISLKVTIYIFRTGDIILALISIGSPI